jgi:hypothetical protein
MYVFTVNKYSFGDSRLLCKKVVLVSPKGFITLIFLQSLYENEHGRWITIANLKYDIVPKKYEYFIILWLSELLVYAEKNWSTM